MEASGRSGRAAALTHLPSTSATKRSGGRRAHDSAGGGRRAGCRAIHLPMYIVASTILVLGIAADPSKSFISPNPPFFFSPLL